MHLHRTRLLSMAAAATAAALSATAAAPARAQTALPIGGLPEAVAGYTLHPASVAGANDWSCKPTAAHPNPVVLLPGTFFNIGSNFVALAPMLKNAGYCVFATNYGMEPWSLGRVGGMASETESGNQVAAFVDKVLTATGAAKVDIVGHSQGGSMGVNFLKLHGGGNKVATYVGWGQSSGGTDIDGIAALASAMGTLGFASTAIGLVSPGVRDQLAGSAYNQQTAAIPLPAGPRIVSIISRNDEVVTPPVTQQLPGAQNIFIQDECPTDHVGHVGLFDDGPTLQLTLNALGGGPASFHPSCTAFGQQYL